MLTIVVGKTGSGKSLFAMHWLIKELRSTNRQIITTLAVDLEELKKYCDERYEKEDIDVHNRVRQVEKEELRTFWRCRGYRLPAREAIILCRFGDGEAWGRSNAGVCYILDEAQTAFGAREWAKTGTELTEYITQHRKLSDDVMVIAPACALLDKQFRILAHECVVLENLYQKVFRGFKPPQQIRWHSYQNAPPVPGEEPQASGKIYIEPKALAKCYNTAAGMGIVGGAGADKGRKVRGIPWYWLILAIPLGGLAMWFFSRTVVRHGTKAAFETLAVDSSTGTTPIGNALQTNTIGKVGKSSYVGTSLPVESSAVAVGGWTVAKSDGMTNQELPRIVAAIKGQGTWIIRLEDGDEFVCAAYNGRYAESERGRHYWFNLRRAGGVEAAPAFPARPLGMKQ